MHFVFELNNQATAIKMNTKTMSPILKATLGEALKLYLPPKEEWDEEDEAKWQFIQGNQEGTICAFRGRYIKRYINMDTASPSGKHYWTERKWNAWTPN